jgi:hypothetical protein
MIVIPTSTVTQTAAPIPYEQLIPEGWVQIKSELVEIWVPASFKSMDIAKFTATAEAQSEKTGIGLGESEGTVDLVLLDDRPRQSLRLKQIGLKSIVLCNSRRSEWGAMMLFVSLLNFLIKQSKQTLLLTLFKLETPFGLLNLLVIYWTFTNNCQILKKAFKLFAPSNNGA